jgi:hypothetical protein
LKEQIDNTQNPLIRGAAGAKDAIFAESACARAVKEMQKTDPNFEIEDLAFEVEEIFKEFYCNVLSGNVEYIEKACGGQALALNKAWIELRKKQGWHY